MSEAGIESYLRTPADWVAVNNMGDQIFKQARFDLLDEFTMLILPIIHSVYCGTMMRHDDRSYARDDLIQTAIMTLYYDMKYRWDKYILVDNYAEYIKTITRNVMIGTVYEYHNSYDTVEYDPDLGHANMTEDENMTYIENKMVVETFYETVGKMSLELAKFRVPYSKLLRLIIERLYIDREPIIEDLKSRFRVIGISKETFSFLLDHSYYLYRLSYNHIRAEIKGNKKMTSRLNQVVERMKDPTYEILSRNYSDTIIPEVFAEFGRDITERFIKTFSGRSVEVPEFKDFSDDLLGPTVWEISEGDRDNLKNFCDTCGLPHKSVLRIFDRYKKYRETYMK